MLKIKKKTFLFVNAAGSVSTVTSQKFTQTNLNNQTNRVKQTICSYGKKMSYNTF